MPSSPDRDQLGPVIDVDGDVGRTVVSEPHPAKPPPALPCYGAGGGGAAAGGQADPENRPMRKGRLSRSLKQTPLLGTITHVDKLLPAGGNRGNPPAGSRPISPVVESLEQRGCCSGATNNGAPWQIVPSISAALRPLRRICITPVRGLIRPKAASQAPLNAAE